LIREDRVVGNIHLEVAIKYATANFENKRTISKSIWNEILLYLSLQRQVHRAFEIVGVKNYSGTVVRVEYSSTPKKKPQIDAGSSKMKYWGVKSVEELLERMALFHIENY
jgi:tRNA threonylcarbamoyladenosine modification (KEOPS) complex Cgi121 subunit